MFSDLGGPLWLLIDVIAVLALAAAIAYGTMTWKRKRNTALENVRDEATRRLYQDDRPEKAS